MRARAPTSARARADVVEVLPTGRMRGEGGGDERQRAANAGVRHPRHRCPRGRVPVAVAPVERQSGAAGVQSARAALPAGARFWALMGLDAVEVEVVLSHLEQARAGNAAPARDVLEGMASRRRAVPGPPKETSTMASWGVLRSMRIKCARPTLSPCNSSIFVPHEKFSVRRARGGRPLLRASLRSRSRGSLPWHTGYE